MDPGPFKIYLTMGLLADSDAVWSGSIEILLALIGRGLPEFERTCREVGDLVSAGWLEEHPVGWRVCDRQGIDKFRRLTAAQVSNRERQRRHRERKRTGAEGA